MNKLKLILIALLTANSIAFSQKEEKKKLSDGIYASFVTEKGSILVKLEDELAPMTVANFVGLSEGGFKPFDTLEIKKPFYVNILFHRVIANFMIQGGDPTASGNGSAGYSFFDEFNEKLKHDRAGILSMANSGPNTNGSQFFITHKETPWLNNRHTVFGKVISGQNVVDSIQQNDTLYRVDILRIGKVAKKFDATKVFQENYNKRIASMKAEKERIEKIKNMSIPDYKEYFKTEMLKVYPKATQTESGLMIVIEKEGSGETPKAGDNVSVHYTGMFTDGKVFDSSIPRKEPITFPVGKGMVIKGWDEGISLLKKGAKAKLIIPYYLAYGPNGRAVIPPYATLIFDVELVDFVSPSAK